MSIDEGQLELLRTALSSRYRIVREIGRGGMATVYLAEDLRHDRRVALKVLASHIAAALGTQRFLREIQIAAVLAHPHILPLYDSGEAAGLIFYAMPYVEGETLRDRLTRQTQLPIADAIQIVREVADGLGYAHNLGIVHRDIKPENILFMGGHAVIADFGVATAIDTAADARITEVGLAVGTPTYMSPEQATGEQNIDSRSDTYSLACVLYELLLGEPPFAGTSFRALLAKKIADPVPALSHVTETVSPALDAVIQRALATNPADRFDTVTAFAQAVAEASSAGPSGFTAKNRGIRKMLSPRVSIPLIGVLATILIAVVWRQQAEDEQSKTRIGQLAAGQSTIAVLPFENLGAPDEDYFTAGMADEIASRLDAVSGLGVVPSRAAQRYTRKDMTMRDIGRALDIEYLLTGSVRWAGAGNQSKNVRITIQLIRARDEQQLWSNTYDRVIDDIFDVQSQIATEVVNRLGVTLAAGERTRLSTKPTENHDAYTLYLKGRHFWNKRTEADLQVALDYFQQAVDLDPGYSRAWVGIADGWISRGWYSRLAPRDAFPKAKHAASRALEFDSTLAESHATMAHIHFEFDHDWESAEREYKRAIELDSTYATAHQWYGGFLSGMGRHDEALKHAEIARSLDPLSLIIQTWIGLRHYFAGNNDKAIAEYRKAIELDSSFAPAHWHLGWAFAESGRAKEAIAEAERALAIDPQSLVYLASLGHAYARAGMNDQARSTLAQLMQASRERHVSAYHVAAIHVALGDTSAGMEWLNRAYEEQSPWIGYLRVDPRFNHVRDDPRFQALLRRARLAGSERQ